LNPVRSTYPLFLGLDEGLSFGYTLNRIATGRSGSYGSRAARPIKNPACKSSLAAGFFMFRLTLREGILPTMGSPALFDIPERVLETVAS